VSEEPKPRGRCADSAARYRCRVGGEYKPLDAFSNAQRKLAVYNRFQSSTNQHDYGMVCKDHTALEMADIQCSMCLLTKPVDDFSNINRRLKDPVRLQHRPELRYITQCSRSAFVARHGRKPKSTTSHQYRSRLATSLSRKAKARYGGIIFSKAVSSSATTLPLK
jgi:hypothetical protein